MAGAMKQELSEVILRIPVSLERGGVNELLSDSTAAVDRGEKKSIYQDTWRVPDYFWFHPETPEFQGFHLVEGEYQPLEPTAQGWLWSAQLNLYLGVDNQILRFFTPEGRLVPLPEIEAQQRAEQAQQQVEQAQQQRQNARSGWN